MTAAFRRWATFLRVVHGRAPLTVAKPLSTPPAPFPLTQTIGEANV